MGCLTYVRKPDPKIKELARRVYECVFIGYADNNKALRFLDLHDNVLIESLDADLYKDEFSYLLSNVVGNSRVSQTSTFPTPNAPQGVSPNNDNVKIEPSRSKHARTDYVVYTTNLTLILFRRP